VARCLPGIVRGIERLAAALLMLWFMAAGCRSAPDSRIHDHGFSLPPDKGPPAVPCLVVVIVDQLGASVARERWPALPFEGGFARLRREGLTVRDMRYAHAVAQTAPGNAALFTGATPRTTGIVGNAAVASPGAEPVSILTDPATRSIVLPGTVPEAHGVASSLRALRVETLADVLMEEHPLDALAVSVSLKDHVALFGGGRHPAFAAWWDPRWASFVTSSALPPRASDLAQAAASGYAAAVEARANPASDGKAPRASAGGDRAVLAVAESLIDTASQVSGPRLIVLSFSASSDSWDELRRIDNELAELLATLDRWRGPSGYAVMLTAAQGRSSGSEPSPKAMTAALEQAVAAELGPGPWIAGIAAPWVFLTDRGNNLPAADRAHLTAAAGRALRAQFGVADVRDIRAEPSECPLLQDESMDALICRSTVPDGTADVLLVPHPKNDRSVPLIIRAPGTIPRSTVIDSPLAYTAFTHTAAALLHIRPPAAAEPGPDLTSARSRQLAGAR
jgi:hypothetical protein